MKQGGSSRSQTRFDFASRGWRRLARGVEGEEQARDVCNERTVRDLLWPEAARGIPSSAPYNNHHHPSQPKSSSLLPAVAMETLGIRRL